MFIQEDFCIQLEKSPILENLKMFQLLSLVGDFVQFWEIYRFFKVKEFGTTNYEADGYTVFLIVMMLVGICFTTLL